MTTKVWAEISVRSQLSIGLEVVDAIGANEFKRDTRALEALQGIKGAKYDISLYCAVALILNTNKLVLCSSSVALKPRKIFSSGPAKSHSSKEDNYG